MSPFLPHTHAFLDGRSASGTGPPASAVPATKNQRVVFILCEYYQAASVFVAYPDLGVVFGSLLVCALAATAVYLTRRWMHKRHQARVMALHRDASFLAGTPSVLGTVLGTGAPLTTPAHVKRARRGRTRTRSGPLTRLALPSPELGSVFRLDSTLLRSSSTTTTPAIPTEPLPPSEPMPAPKHTSPHNRSLFSNGSTLVGSPPFDKYDMPLRAMNPPLTSPNTNTTHLQKPNPVYRSPSREQRLVRTTASADSLASTPPLSPEAAPHARQGTFTLTSLTTGPRTPAPSVVHKTLSKQSMSSSTSSQRTGKAVEVESPYLTGLDYTPFVLPTVQESSPPPPLGRHRSADEALHAPVGTPVTLSHFPFRFSHKATSSPNISSTGLPPTPSSNLGVQNPAAAHSSPNVPSSQRHGPGLMNNNGGAWTLPHSMSSIKLKIRHAASDEIIAIAFVPHTINFRAVRDAIRTRLGFRPRRIWSDDDNVEITDDTSLWSWLDEQYTRGHTRLILQAE
ncbi:hypothetical protein FRC10_001630 [Ceratobasidium sp. 414]|nr:hypothetical protein FRC10_001630 [Ceratobasidium sp. 414]